MKVKAVLFDVRSIQQYIYAGTKLKTNIGASYLVEHLFDRQLADTIKFIYGEQDTDVSAWQTSGTAIGLNGKKCVIAYIGGGSALVLMDPSLPEDAGKELVKDFSARLLVQCPGLQLGAAIGEIDTEDTSGKDISGLYHQLKVNQDTVLPTVSLPYTGFTYLCDIDGEVANFKSSERYISQEAAAKNEASEKATSSLIERFAGILGTYGEPLTFPSEIDKLGQREHENYFSIVHIDGNNMGEKFMNIHGLGERRKISGEIRKKTEKAFADLLESILEDMRQEKYSFLAKQYKVDDNGKKLARYLPIRPLIIGGDDITFVCPAKLAVAYTKRFIDNMMEESAGFSDVSKSIDSCGGIAILPTSYPFFRGYVMAEQLCDSAKKQMRALKSETGRGSCWIDFVKLHGEQAPTLEQIVSTEYQAVLGNMHFGPYMIRSVGQSPAADGVAMLSDLLEGVKQLQCSKGNNADDFVMAHNKVKEFRAVLQMDRKNIDAFMLQLEHTHKSLPSVAGWAKYSKQPWVDGRTPYIDAIELMDFCEGV